MILEASNHNDFDPICGIPWISNNSVNVASARA